MNNKRKNIALVAGGFTAEYAISLKSAETILSHIDSEKYRVFWVEITKKSWELVTETQRIAIDKNDFSFILDGQKIRPDGVYIMIHGIPGEDGSLQGYFNLINMPFIGPDLLSAAITMNKAFTSYLLKSLGFTTAKLVLLHEKKYNPTDIIAAVGLPCIVKPNDGGSSFGVTKVKIQAELDQAIEHAFSSSNQVLVEEFITGKEYSGGVSDFSGSVQALPITALLYETEFFDFSAKYEGKSQEITPAPLSIALTQKMQVMLVDIYQKLNLSGTVRIDFLLSEDIPYIIEINSIPGMTSASMIPAQLKTQGISLHTFVNESLAQLLK
jgi:D-alanine-D-alanine ligase